MQDKSRDVGVVLVPGFMTDATLWDDVAAALSRIGPVVRADISEGATIAAMADLVLAVCPPRFVLCGFSLGGYVAREIVLRVPDRVAGLALIATSARPDGAVQAQRQAAAHAVAPAAFRGLSRAALADSLHPRHASDEALIERIRAMNVRLGPEVFMRQSALRRGDDRGRLPGIACPTLVVAGDGDRLRSLDESRELAEGIAGARLSVIEESGHMIPVEQPARLAEAILDWWDDALT
jgi:pimeloyl-ACP methyl ester carboxylesterase